MENYIKLLMELCHSSKYSRWYIEIIRRGNSRMIGNIAASKRHNKNQFDYLEAHHILPKMLCDNAGQKTDTANFALLTPREHFICHWLLSKMFIDFVHKAKASNALGCMFRSCKNHSRNFLESKSKFYSRIRENNPSGMKGVKKPDGFGDKTRIAKTGVPLSESHKSKIADSRLVGLSNGTIPPHPWKNKSIKSMMTDEEYELFLQNCKKNSSHPGELNGFYGKTHSKESIQLNKLKHTGVYLVLDKYIISGKDSVIDVLEENGFKTSRSADPIWKTKYHKIGNMFDFINNNIQISSKWIDMIYRST